MNSPKRENLIKYGISGGISIAMLLVYVLTRVDIHNPGATPLVDWFLYLCDGFTLPGVTFFLLGCAVSLSNQGALDGIGYIFTITVKKLIPNGAKDLDTYKEYIEHRRENRVSGYGFLYVVGGVCLGFALVFMILFYSLYKK